MTEFLVNISSRRDVLELMYLETAKTNLIYALGKYIQASSSRSGANKAVSSVSFRKVKKKTFGSLVRQYLSLTSLFNTYGKPFSLQALIVDTLTSLKLLRRVMRTLAEGKLIGAEATVIHTEVIEILVARLHPDGVPGSRLLLETGSVQLPDSADAVEGFSRGVENFVDVEVLQKLEVTPSDALSNPEPTMYNGDSTECIAIWSEITRMSSDQSAIHLVQLQLCRVGSGLDEASESAISNFSKNISKAF